MPTLADQLGNFIETINDGPLALDPDLFAGPADRVMLGLKAHANTISHARLVALEETFPMTRAEIGDDIFNGLSRSYVETESARTCDNNDIGADFPDFLIARNIPPTTADLSRIEWAWLESYNAAEAQPLSADMLAGLDEAALLALPIRAHPAARLIPLHAPLSPQLSELGDATGAAAILITRPSSTVLLQPIDTLSARLLDGIDNLSNMGNLLSLALEQLDEEMALQPILALIGAGALVVPANFNEHD